MDIHDTIRQMRLHPRQVRFADALRCAEHFFGPPRVHGSHHVFKMPWAGDPRVNLQDRHSFAPSYQVGQLLRAIERLGEDES